MRTLGAAARTFARCPTPLLMAGSAAGLLAARVLIGDWQWWQLGIVAAVVLGQPFVEWSLHVSVLHMRPLRFGGRRFDTVVAREHRKHHADPRDLDLGFIPLRVLGYGGLALLAISATMPSWAGRVTAALVMTAQALVYEWTHFLIHTDYKPRTAAYRRLYAAHRLHHYRNERYWFGVTRTFGDRVLGTAPDKEAVPVSATCKALPAA